jgi:hypothetical protein
MPLYSIPPATGDFVVTDWNLRGIGHARVILAAAAAFLVTGIASDLDYGYSMSAGQASFVYAGQAAQLSRSADAASGSFTLTGNVATFSFTMDATQQGYTLTGLDAFFAGADNMAADHGSFTLTGNDGAAYHDKQIGGGVGDFEYQGFDLGDFAFTMDAGYAQFTLTGNDGDGEYERSIEADYVLFDLDGFPATLTWDGVECGQIVPRSCTVAQPVARRSCVHYWPGLNEAVLAATSTTVDEPSPDADSGAFDGDSGDDDLDSDLGGDFDADSGDGGDGNELGDDGDNTFDGDANNGGGGSDIGDDGGGNHGAPGSLGGGGVGSF